MPVMNREDEKFKTVDNPFFGMQVYVKSGQKRACWMIGDAELASRYLTGEVNEEHLERCLKWNKKITEREEPPSVED